MQVPERELCAWLDSTAPENAAYFERLMALCAALVHDVMHYGMHYVMHHVLY